MRNTQVLKKLEDLYFEVRREPLVTTSGIETSKFAIIRNDSNKVIGVVGKDYQLIENKQLIETVIPKLKSLGDFRYNKIITVNDGAKSFVELVFPNRTVEIKDSHDNLDHIQPTLTLSNSYDMTKKLGFVAGVFRLVCSNGAFIGVKAFSYIKIHVNIDLREVIKSGTDVLNLLVSRVFPFYQKMAMQKISKNRIHSLKENLGEGILRKMSILNEDGECILKADGDYYDATEWSVYNSATRYLTHEHKGSYLSQLAFNQKLTHVFGLDTIQ